MEPLAEPLLADLLFHLFDASQLDARSAPRLLGCHAGAKVFVHQHLEVGTHFSLNLRLHPAGGEQIAQEASRPREERHPGYP